LEDNLIHRWPPPSAVGLVVFVFQDALLDSIIHGELVPDQGPVWNRTPIPFPVQLRNPQVHRQMQLAALDMAYRRRKPPKGLIFHSDRGVQYASKAYRERLDAYGIRQSMSRKGDPYDNAVAENFFSCLKCELIHLKHYPTRSAAQCDVFAYLEIFYNTLRPHSALGWVSPSRFEDDLLRSAA